jgi:steroid 5-alpha reductase family enzyme
MAHTECPWCEDSNNDEWSPLLCYLHLAEYEGVSIAELQRMEEEQYAEYVDTVEPFIPSYLY